MFDLFNSGDMQANVLMIIKAIAAVGGAVLGWFVSDPLTRIAYRVSFKGATPGAILFLAKASGATALGATMWALVAFGGGPGGPFSGGLGPGSGRNGVKDGVKDAVPGKDVKPTKDKIEAKPKSGSLESIDIEIIDDKRYQDDGKDRYFLVKGAQPALSRAELEEYFKKNSNFLKIEVRPVLTEGSVRTGGDDSALSQLLSLTKQYEIKTLQTKTP